MEMDLTGKLLSVERVSYSLSKSQKPILEDISFDLMEGECVSIIGRSGVGKSTFLNLCAGIIQPTAGEVQRNISVGMPASVTQNYSVFPNLTGRENVEIAVRKLDPILKRMMPSKQAKRLAAEKLELMQATDFADLYPSNMSGGQRQRIAVAQALSQNSKIILMDEPFGAIDYYNRELIQGAIIDLVRNLGISVILVTHDIDEAIYLGDRVFMLSKKPTGIERGASLETVSISGNAINQPAIKFTENFRKSVHFVQSQLYSLDTAHLGTTRKGRGVINETYLAELEASAQSVWVISKELRQETNNKIVNNVVTSNLRLGTHYHYFTPLEPTEAVTALKSLFVGTNVLSNQVYFSKLDSNDFLLEFGETIIFEPNQSGQVGFSYFGGDLHGSLFDLPESLLDTIVHRLNLLKCVDLMGTGWE